jgi:hypothetical protein
MRGADPQLENDGSITIGLRAEKRSAGAGLESLSLR